MTSLCHLRWVWERLIDSQVDDTAPATSYPRINTWSGGLNEMEEDLLDDPVLELAPLEKAERPEFGCRRQLKTSQNYTNAQKILKRC